MATQNLRLAKQDGVVFYEDRTWADVRYHRDIGLTTTDLWYLKDRWDQLSSTAKGQLNTYRESLRQLPQNYADANTAAENFPSREDWF